MLIYVLTGAIKLLVVFVLLLLYALFMLWFERKALGFIQIRIGPKLVSSGLEGLLQPIADMLKTLWKEDIVPHRADKLVFWLAPVIGAMFPFAAAMAMPFGPPLKIGGSYFYLSVVHVNVGILYILAALGLTSYGVLSAGIASGGNKYSLISAQREVAQMVSYEVVMALALLNPILMAQSLDLYDIVAMQAHHLWFVFYQPVAFVVFLICMFATAAIVPFDLPEAEQELVAGFNTEYSAMKMGMFPFGQFVTILVMSSLMVIFFLGGWTGPIWNGHPWILGFIWYWIKVFFFVFLFIWSWGTFPRYRYDQLMNICWKILLPISVLNILWTGFALIIHIPMI
ncbi:MAG: NADH-quinone oxidoreductase subunit NuoH [Desulfurellaceae bacterium]|jgi:NADH-quinone oxidoreductase subunit H|nr:NADH-quinone oxidoreductase subunit NuoH [Desulfurellaceae bacterium]